MTSPQLENGHTRIANEILEQVARHDFTGGELRILLVLWRQTYGYGKKSDAISIGQFEKKTGISRRGVFKCLNSLQGRNVIQKIATNSGPNEWRYNKDSDAWGVNHSSLVNQSARVNHSSLVGGEPQCTKGGEPECTHKRNKKRKKTPLPPKGGLDGFEEFYQHYPKKVGKGAARKAWKKIKPSKELVSVITASIQAQVKADHFRGTNGKLYEPLPTTWLNQGRWEDEIQKPTEKKDKYW